MAVWLSISARETVSKIIAIWWPTAAFVALALDHVVANMYFIPIGIWNGTPKLTVGYYIWKSLIPATLGNIIGGGVFVALPYWYLYLTGEGDVEVDFNIGPVESAIREGGGPLRNGHILLGREMDSDHPASQLPHSGGHLKSQVSKELSKEDYGRPRRAVEQEKAGESNSDQTV